MIGERVPRAIGAQSAPYELAPLITAWTSHQDPWSLEPRFILRFPLRQYAENAYTTQSRKGGEICKCAGIDNGGGTGKLVSRS